MWYNVSRKRYMLRDNGFLATALCSVLGHKFVKATLIPVWVREIPGINWRKLPIYVLYGFKDTFEEAQYRANMVWELGGHPFCMPYKELDQLTKVQPESSKKNWSPRLYTEFARFHNRVKMFSGGKGSIYEHLKRKSIEVA